MNNKHQDTNGHLTDPIDTSELPIIGQHDRLPSDQQRQDDDTPPGDISIFRAREILDWLDCQYRQGQLSQGTYKHAIRSVIRVVSDFLRISPREDEE